MTDQQIEETLRHLATKEDLALTHVEIQQARADLEKSLREQLKWIIILQLPNSVGVVAILIAILFHK